MLAASGVAGAVFAFRQASLLVDPIYPALSALFVYGAATLQQYIVSDREKRFVRRAFSQYLAPELLSKLEEHPDAMKLGGEMRQLSIMFMDVRGFTPISEMLAPHDLVHFLNTLLSPLSDAIQFQAGTIDKYIGDSIMAFWNAPLETPDHAALACRAALRMREIVGELNEADAFGFKAGHKPIQEVQIGVGINTGPRLRRQHGLRPPLQLFGRRRCGERRRAHRVELQDGRLGVARFRGHGRCRPRLRLPGGGRDPAQGQVATGRAVRARRRRGACRHPRNSRR